MINLDWKKDMDKLYKLTIKNWYKTGKAKKSSAVTGSISLKGKDERSLKS